MFIIKKDDQLSYVERQSQVDELLTLGNRIVVYDEKGHMLCHNAYSYILADIPRIHDRWKGQTTTRGGPADWVKKEVARLNSMPYEE